MEEPHKVPGYSLRQLLYFVAVAEKGTVSAASERLRVSPSAVSLAISELERALKVQLCVRRKAHGVTLTVSGTQLLHHARALLRQARELLEKGERATVLEYFRLCGAFWPDDQLERWADDVRHGRTPNFGPSADR